jgi:transcriptional regulator with XRE-family HTH domain
MERGKLSQKGVRMPILRNELGDVLRDARLMQGKTLRDISSEARVSLGYLSEVERGQKEASSELLASICVALDVPMSTILREVSDRFALAEGFASPALGNVPVMPSIPDTVPELLGTFRGQ